MKAINNLIIKEQLNLRVTEEEEYKIEEDDAQLRYKPLRIMSGNSKFTIKKKPWFGR